MPSTSLRVLTIAHNAVAASNRARTDALRQIPGVEVQLITPAWWYEEGCRIDAAGDTDWRIGRTVFTGNGTRHIYLSGLAGLIRRCQPDVLDLYEEPFSLVALQTTLMRELFAPRAALVFYSAVNVEREWRWPYRAIERLVLRRADAAHAPNADVPRILRRKGMRDQPIAVVPLGVEVERFASAQPMDLSYVPAPRVGFIGRFEPVKGIDVLVDAFGRLRTRASLVAVGDGPQRDHLNHQSVYRLPPLAYEQVPSLLKALDVVVLPSVTILPLHREQFGRVLVEAMAAGVPVIGSSSGAIPEVIGDAGLVVSERDPAALADAIDRVLTQADLRQMLVERGRRRVTSRFSWPVVAAQTVDLLRAALGYRRRVPSLEAARA
jgi:glycosyltransferase involved in cell wall biosynthesis